MEGVLKLERSLPGFLRLVRGGFAGGKRPDSLLRRGVLLRVKALVIRRGIRGLPELSALGVYLPISPAQDRLLGILQYRSGIGTLDDVTSIIAVTDSQVDR